MKKEYLPLYKEWMRVGSIPRNGLCACFIDDRIFDLIDPERGEMETYWGYNSSGRYEKVPEFKVHYSFTPLRQTIVLLMAAINNEL